MSDKVEVKAEALPDLDDLLQCPVCYEIPSGQIFQCNEGHHVCGRCKLRLDMCPVCRALFFGTRNYAMEELISNVTKLRAFKLGGKVTSGSVSADDSNTSAVEETPPENDNAVDDDNHNFASRPSFRAPQACKGLFRCLCCKNGNTERLPAGRLLNHLRYFHSPELIEFDSYTKGRWTLNNRFKIESHSVIQALWPCRLLYAIDFLGLNCELALTTGIMPVLQNMIQALRLNLLLKGQSENGEYVQAWQFSTTPGRLVTAVRVADMGIFFLIIEISNDLVSAWLTMASSPWVAHEFCYTVTISGNDREAIFSDCVWSVRSCEGSLRKRGHCLVVEGLDAVALVAPATISGKLSVRRVPTDQLTQVTQPRAVMRVASRGNAHNSQRTPVAQDLEPFLQDLQNDVARLSRAFATLGREANALVRSEAELRARNVGESPAASSPVASRLTPDQDEHVLGLSLHGAPPPATPQLSSEPTNPTEHVQLSRNARRRMRQRLRAALNAPQSPPARAAPATGSRQTGSGDNFVAASQRQNGPLSNVPITHITTGLAIVQPTPPPVPPQTSSGPSNSVPQNGNQTRANKKRRQRR